MELFKNTIDHIIDNNVLDKCKSSIKDYLVDTSAGMVFYQPLFVINEYFIAGLESEQVLKSRLTGLVIASLINRPVGIFRQYWADLWKADHNSSKIKKYVVDTSAITAVQLPCYLAVMNYVGADIQETMIAASIMVGIGALTNRIYGKFLDRWRKYFGTKPTLEKE